MVNVAFICDNGYVMPTIVAIISLIENKSRGTQLGLYILADNLSLENKEVFLSLATKSCRVALIEVDSTPYKGVEKQYSNVSRASLLKFSIPEIIREVDKVLYLDGDIVVRKDLSELYEIDLANHYAAVVADGPKKKVPGGRKHVYCGDPLYFNSGMMLLNLRKMREEGLTQRLIDFRLYEYNYFMDQDAFNRVFGRNVIHLSLQYNMLLHLISFQNEDYSMKQLSDFYHLSCYETVDDMLDDAVVLHYTLAKPWRYFDIPGADVWMTYYRKSSFGNITLERSAFTTYVLGAKIYRIARACNSVVNIVRRLFK